MANDTSEGARTRYFELLRAMQPQERLERAVALSRAVRELAEAGIRERHPSIDEAEVRVRLAVRLYGRAAAERVFRTVPADAV